MVGGGGGMSKFPAMSTMQTLKNKAINYVPILKILTISMCNEGASFSAARARAPLSPTELATRLRNFIQQW